MGKNGKLFYVSNFNTPAKCCNNNAYLINCKSAKTLLLKYNFASIVTLSQVINKSGKTQEICQFERIDKKDFHMLIERFSKVALIIKDVNIYQYTCIKTDYFCMLAFYMQYTLYNRANINYNIVLNKSVECLNIRSVNLNYGNRANLTTIQHLK